MQTKISSFVETMMNVLTGFFITLIISPFIYMACGIEASPAKMTYATLLFTVVSIVRGYVIRRWFNNSPPFKKRWMVRMGETGKGSSKALKAHAVWQVYSVSKYRFATPSEFALSEHLFKLRNSGHLEFDTLEPIMTALDMYIVPTDAQLEENRPILVDTY